MAAPESLKTISILQCSNITLALVVVQTHLVCSGDLCPYYETKLLSDKVIRNSIFRLSETCVS